MSERYGIGEWYGRSFLALTAPQRLELAERAQRHGRNAHFPCPFQAGTPPCGKQGGVCGLRKYSGQGGGIVGAESELVVTCPRRFEQAAVVLRWLADILGLDSSRTRFATEVPFMANTRTGKPAGKLDLVIGESRGGRLSWHGLEIQAVYFSGPRMGLEFLNIANHPADIAPFPRDIRRPDWRSSSAKRLMPQLQIKGPTLRRWGAKLAVCVDRPFFASIGGPSTEPSRDLDSGDIIWMVPEITEDRTGSWRLRRGFWEVMTLEDAVVKLLAAKTITRSEFEEALARRLRELPR